MNVTRLCPKCGEMGDELPGLSDRLRACMNTDCRVNEYEVQE